MSIKRVLQELDTAHDQTLAFIASVNDRELTQLQFFSWTGKSFTVSDYVRSGTSSHYRWARNKIRKWLAKLD